MADQPTAVREFRGAWVATVDNIDWPSKPGLAPDQLKAEMTKILNMAEELKLNALIFQVRPSADAMYPSQFEPWSWFLTGEQGKPPADGFDPLAWTVEESHKRGIELHVWLNPYRALHPAQKGPVANSHLSVTNPSSVKKYGTYLWMDPTDEVVQNRSYDVFMDLVNRYDIDGIHIDDYFYPYKVVENGVAVDFPDEESWMKVSPEVQAKGRDNWRRANVDKFIERVYKGIKERKAWVKFGISPFGIYRPNVPEGIKAGVDQYADLYADAKKWLELGWCDYFAPQLYWPIKQTPQSFPVLLKYWREVNKKGRHIWPGQFTSRLNPKDGNWQPSEVGNQIRLTRKGTKSPGTIHFSFKAFLQDWNGIDWALKNSLYKDRALVPSSPWLDKSVPRRVEGIQVDKAAATISAVPLDKDARFFAIYLNDGKKWWLAKVGPAANVPIFVPGLRSAKKIDVRVVDRTGNEGPSFIKKL